MLLLIYNERKPGSSMKVLRRMGFALLGVMGLLALLCSIAANAVTNGNLMKEGFLQFSDTAHLSVKASSYEEYAAVISGYLDGKADDMQQSTFAESPGADKLRPFVVPEGGGKDFGTACGEKVDKNNNGHFCFSS